MLTNINSVHATSNKFSFTVHRVSFNPVILQALQTKSDLNQFNATGSEPNQNIDFEVEYVVEGSFFFLIEARIKPAMFSYKVILNGRTKMEIFFFHSDISNGDGKIPEMFWLWQYI